LVLVEIKSLEQLTSADKRTLRFTPLGFSMMGELKPEYAAEFQQRVIAHCDLYPDVPDDTRNSFELVRMLHSYGVLFYEAFTIAYDLSWLVMEQAFRERFVTYFNGAIPLVNTKTKVEKPLNVKNFDEVYQALTHGGSYAQSRWRLKLRSTGQQMEFRATFSHLLKWARKEGLLCGQHNRRTEEVYQRIRNRVAHPVYHVQIPPGSARTISDLAEIINQLWGHSTPGGRLYPAPLEREVLVVAWTDNVDNQYRILRGNQLELFTDPGNWTCIVIRGVWGDDILEFDAQYERTKYPAELLWGPGSREEALAWIKEEKPQADTVSYLDRLFAVRIHEGRMSFPRRPEVALALPPERQLGLWLLVRSDFTFDALTYTQDIKDNIVCGDDSPDTSPSASYPAEEIFRGEYDGMVDKLVEHGITESEVLCTVRVPSRFLAGDASDVESD
jgi:hypothetical protein